VGLVDDKTNSINIAKNMTVNYGAPSSVDETGRLSTR
jgi:hypothetical protein